MVEGGTRQQNGARSAIKAALHPPLCLLLLPFSIVACSESSDRPVDRTSSGGFGGFGMGGSAGIGGTGAADSGVIEVSLKRFESANPLVREATWRPGAPITIEGVNGEIEVVQGAGNGVRAVFTPFVYRKSDTPESEITSNLEQLVAEVLADAGGVSGAVLVRTTRAAGTPSTLGADIAVEIPPTFDGRLSIRQNNGTTAVSFAGNANGIALESASGSCAVACSAAAAALSLICDNGDLAVDVPAAPAGNDVRTIRTDVGNIAVSFANVPAAQRFSVQAATSDGLVQITGGATCQVQDVSAGSKIASCHGAAPGDPVYQVSAGAQSDIFLTF